MTEKNTTMNKNLILKSDEATLRMTLGCPESSSGYTFKLKKNVRLVMSHYHLCEWWMWRSKLVLECILELLDCVFDGLWERLVTFAFIWFTEQLAYHLNQRPLLIKGDVPTCMRIENYGNWPIWWNAIKLETNWMQIHNVEKQENLIYSLFLIFGPSKRYRDTCLDS